MKRLTCFAVLLLLLMQYGPASAQTCSAAFTPVVHSNKTVTFYPADSIGISHRWLFGDGSSVSTTAFTVTHAYAAPGQYLVVHYTERPGTTCHDSVAKIITIPADSCTITAAFKYRRDSLDCKKIYFDNYSSPISPNVHFAWTFGDGTSSTAVNPVHTYATSGTYLVSLVSESGTNCRKQVWDTVYVKCADSCNITAKFQYWKDSLNCKTIHFVNTSSPISPNVHFAWTFGDGTSSTAVNPVHTYAISGTYLVSLVSESGTNCRKQVWDTVYVKCGVDSCTITAKFQYRKDSLNCKTIHFVNTSSPISPNVHFAWTFGDGTSSTAVNPVHTYATSGTYLVSLVSESGTNCRRKVWDTVYVKCADSCAYQPFFGWRADSLTTGKIYFTNLTAGSAAGIHYTWYFGDSSAVSHDVSPSHSYTHIGTYSVCLVAESGSCRKMYCQPVYVDKTLNGSGLVPAIPNPAISSVTINVTLDRPETVIIRIMDGNGITRAEFSKNGLTGNNRFTLPVERLSRGIYLVEIRTGTHKWLSRFQKG